MLQTENSDRASNLTNYGLWLLRPLIFAKSKLPSFTSQRFRQQWYWCVVYQESAHSFNASSRCQSISIEAAFPKRPFRIACFHSPPVPYINDAEWPDLSIWYVCSDGLSLHNMKWHFPRQHRRWTIGDRNAQCLRWAMVITGISGWFAFMKQRQYSSRRTHAVTAVACSDSPRGDQHEKRNQQSSLFAYGIIILEKSANQSCRW